MRISDLSNLSQEDKNSIVVKFKSSYLSGGRKMVSSVFCCEYSYIGHLATALNINLKELHTQRVILLRSKPRFANPFFS